MTWQDLALALFLGFTCVLGMYLYVFPSLNVILATLVALFVRFVVLPFRRWLTRPQLPKGLIRIQDGTIVDTTQTYLYNMEEDQKFGKWSPATYEQMLGTGLTPQFPVYLVSDNPGRMQTILGQAQFAPVMDVELFKKKQTKTVSLWKAHPTYLTKL